MDSRGQFIATLLDASAKGFATGAIVRMSEANESEVDAWGFGRLVDDTHVRLQNLGEALATGRPELLKLDIDWLAATYAAREVPVEFLERRLRCLRDELEENLPTDAAKMACSYVDSALNGLGETPCEVGSLLADDQPHVGLARSFLLAVLEVRRADAERMLVDAFEGGVSVPELHHHVIQKVQAEIGRLWQVGDVHVAEEHLVSRIVEQALAVLRSKMPEIQANGRCVLTASVRGNLHDIGARLVADHFEMSGWRSLFLGADTPTEDLTDAVGQFDVDLVAVSACLGLNIRATAELVASIHARHPDVPVLVGGPPFTLLPDLWRNVGADGFAPDAAGAAREGERLVKQGRPRPK